MYLMILNRKAFGVRNLKTQLEQIKNSEIEHPKSEIKT